jgi:hypothetical protein
MLRDEDIKANLQDFAPKILAHSSGRFRVKVIGTGDSFIFSREDH